MENIQITINDTSEFNTLINGFLKKFSTIDRSILLKWGNTDITSTMTTPEKSLIKYSSVETGENVSINKSLDTPIYIPLITAARLTNVLGFYTEGSLDINISTDVINGITVALKMEFTDGKLTMELPCSRIETFKISLPLTDDLMGQLSDTSNPLYSIEFSEKEISNIKNLANNNTNEKLFINAEKGSVNFEGDNFRLKIKDGVGKDHRFPCPKKSIRTLDGNDYSFFMIGDKSIFKSTDGTGILIVSKYIDLQ